MRNNDNHNHHNSNNIDNLVEESEQPSEPTINTHSIEPRLEDSKLTGKLTGDANISKTKGIDFEEFKTELHVGYKHKFKTIQDAIDAAQPKTKILISPGIYKENVEITAKGDLDIISENPLRPAIILAQNSPCIKIYNLLPGAAIKIAGLRFLHRGMKRERDRNDISDNITNNDVTDNNLEKSNIMTVASSLKQFYRNSYEIENLDLTVDMDISIIDGILADNRGYFCAILIINSTVMILNSQITMAFLTQETTKILPGIHAENSTVFMDSVLIKGNSEFLTCGVLSYLTSIKMTNCQVIGHKSGGVLSCITNKTHLVVSKCFICQNSACGIYVFNRSRKKEKIKIDSFIAKYKKKDEDEEEKKQNKNQNDVYIESNLIENNHGAGAKLENCANISVVRNKFFENDINGLELIHDDGLCLLNEMVKNGNNGLLIHAPKQEIELKVSKNVFCENVNNGVIITGKMNEAKIVQNERVTGNMRAGIRIENCAHPIIQNNIINGNLYQGLLICSDSSAVVEQNKLYENLKACIAFGGPGAKDVRIVDNEVFRGRSEGIFCIDGEGGLIARNKVFENNDGIVLMNAQKIEVSENDVYQNIRCGIFVGSKSTPKMDQNQVKENKFIGMYFIGGSKGSYHNNIIEKNPTQCYYDNSCKSLIDEQDENDKVDGRIDMETRCNIF